MPKPALRRRRALATLGITLAVAVAAAGAAVAIATSAAAATTWLTVSVGRDSTCAIKTDRTLWCWGDNTYGKLGVGGGGNQLEPTQIVGITGWESVTVGRNHACGVQLTSGNGFCWGSNMTTGQNGNVPNGKLGLGSSVQSEPAPKRIPGTWMSLTAGDNHTCGVDTSGGRSCWGQNTYGQLGTGDTTTQFTPKKISNSGWVSVSAGMAHTCGVKTTGTTYCWGLTDRGQVGTGLSGSRALPQPVVPSPTSIGDTPSSDHEWTGPTAGSSHSCDVSEAGVLYCWGDNEGSQLGQGTSTGLMSRPQALSGSAGDEEDWTTVDAGHFHNCAIREGGPLYCWGLNQYGQLGVDDKNNRAYATQLPSAWLSVSAGWKHTCAIRINGTLFCWGYNFHGELGLGHTTEQLKPALLP